MNEHTRLVRITLHQYQHSPTDTPLSDAVCIISLKGCIITDRLNTGGNPMNDEFELNQLLIQEVNSLKQRISELQDDLHESEEKYRYILENIEDCYFEVDRAGDFTFLNPSLCRILGYPRGEILGMNYRVLMDAENANKVLKVFNEVYMTGITTRGFEWEVMRKDGVRMYIDVLISLIVKPGEKPTRFRGIARDITKRKQMEGSTNRGHGYDKLRVSKS
jgi:PAS domain S-box-containing protein